ncbi:MAG: Era-like GTP-binding protein, partial [Nodosilinea sp.]
MPAPDPSPQPPAADTTWEEVEAELGELVATVKGTPLALPAADPATWEAVETELGDLVLDFQDLNDDLNYRRAQAALGSLVQRLNLTPREQAGVEDALQNLRGLIDKLENTVVHIAAFGLVGRGKSSLLNALLGQEVFTTGPTHGVTQVVEGSRWQVSQDALGAGTPDLLRVSLKSLGQSSIELIDTPGLDEVDGEDRAALARRIAEQVDLILFVIAGDITRVEYEALQALRQASKPILLVFNKIDQYPEADRQTLYETLRDRRLQDLISPEEIV